MQTFPLTMKIALLSVLTTSESFFFPFLLTSFNKEKTNMSSGLTFSCISFFFRLLSKLKKSLTWLQCRWQREEKKSLIQLCVHVSIYPLCKKWECFLTSWFLFLFFFFIYVGLHHLHLYFNSVWKDSWSNSNLIID